MATVQDLGDILVIERFIDHLANGCVDEAADLFAEDGIWVPLCGGCICGKKFIRTALLDYLRFKNFSRSSGTIRMVENILTTEDLKRELHNREAVDGDDTFDFTPGILGKGKGNSLKTLLEGEKIKMRGSMATPLSMGLQHSRSDSSKVSMFERDVKVHVGHALVLRPKLRYRETFVVQDGRLRLYVCQVKW